MGGYTMLTLAALALLMIAVLNANRIIVSADIEPSRSEKLSEASALAEALLGEIRTRRFDQLVPDSVQASSISDFTPPPLGPDLPFGEGFVFPDTGFQSTVQYNDIDDYNGYWRRVHTPSATTVFELRVQVFYVTETNLTDVSLARTYLKKIMVTVENPPDLAPITFSTILVY